MSEGAVQKSQICSIYRKQHSNNGIILIISQSELKSYAFFAPRLQWNDDICIRSGHPAAPVIIIRTFFAGIPCHQHEHNCISVGYVFDMKISVYNHTQCLSTTNTQHSNANINISNWTIIIVLWVYYYRIEYTHNIHMLSFNNNDKNGFVDI